MFKHIYLYRLKTLIRDRETLFWTLFFPIILGTFFFLGLSGISGAGQFDPIDTAVVVDSNWEQDEDFRATLRALSTGESPLFDLQEVSEAKAEDLLHAGEISGYIKAGQTPQLIVTRSNFGASVTQNFLNQYIQTTAAVTDLVTNNPAEAEAILADLNNRETWIEDLPASANEVDPLLNYFYTLIAMSCLYGSMLGMREVNEIQANQSEMAARVNAAPTKKIKHFVSSASASLTIHFLQIIFLLLFIRFILGVEFGHQTAFIVLTAFIGAICGLSYGSFISSLVRGSAGLKIAILISSTMLMSFLSGMMYAPMKQIVKQRLPFLSYNPVTLLTDAFFSLHYYEGYALYSRDILFLLGFTLVFTMLTYFLIRRPRYASI